MLLNNIEYQLKKTKTNEADNFNYNDLLFYTKIGIFVTESIKPKDENSIDYY